MKIQCAYCKRLACLLDAKRRPENCPREINDNILEEAKKIYESEPQIREMTKNAAIVEASGYREWPRLKDTIEFAKLMKFQKIGLACCVGLLKETEEVAKILENYGFDIYSIMCKTGSVPKDLHEVPKEFQMTSQTGYMIGYVACNPVAQALLLNEYGTDFNIIIGLCVGHDAVFTKYSKAPVTTLIAKDRANSHNPVGVLNNYYWGKYFIKDAAEQKSKK
ncbi:MAG: DUF1847 domain-containing protein [Candidatus Helarchaeota archaeon]|nr:DUF1847 domain-containing protein [Candidatus Helarchaeota archaeon]